jgi:hypothetical protein
MKLKEAYHEGHEVTPRKEKNTSVVLFSALCGEIFLLLSRPGQAYSINLERE